MKTISYLKILVPTAGPVPAREGADYITHIADKLKGELVILHILTPEVAGDPKKRMEGEEALDIFLRSAERRGVKISSYLHKGELVPSIIEFADNKKIDLVVMGAGKDRIVAEWIISDLKEGSKVPVVVVPGGFSEII